MSDIITMVLCFAFFAIPFAFGALIIRGKEIPGGAVAFAMTIIWFYLVSLGINALLD